MRISRPSARPWVAAAAVVAAAVILIATGVGDTHATEPADQQVEENAPGGSAVGTPLNASADGTTVRYALTGPDAASFTINPATGEVSLATDVSPDFEARSEYSLTVTATADVTVRVLNVIEPGAVALSTDDPGAGETITAVLTDPDGGMTNVRWSWAHFDGNNLNVVTGVSGASYTTTTADIGHRIASIASYDDAAATGQHATASTTSPVRNDPPAFPAEPATRQVNENSAAGTAMGDPVTADDPNQDSVSYTASGDANFGVDSTSGQISVADGANLDHEATPAHILTITATDQHGDSASTTVTISIVNIEEAGAVTLQHDLLRNATVITATLADPDGNVSGETWQWGRSDQTITGANANTYTATGDDVGHILTATVHYSDGHGSGKSANAVIASAVGNDAPEFSELNPSRSIDENANVGTNVGTPVAATDPNGDSVRYSVSSDSGFAVDANGQITSTSVLDHETAASHTVRLTATDNHDATATVSVTITVNNVDEAGILTLDQTSPKVGDTVAASLTDPDGTTSGHSWQWQQGDGTTWTSVSEATASTYIVQSADLGQFLNAAVEYTDPQGSGKTASAQTTNAVANDPPTFTTADPFSVSIDENNVIGVNIGTPLVATDPNDDTLTYTVEGDAAANFDVDANGQMTATVSLDYEAKGSHSFTAKVSDPAGGNDVLTVNMTVNNVEEVGVVTFDSDTQPEANVALTASLTDPDGGVTGENWQWQSAASTDGPWNDLTGATSATYTPTADDVDDYLQATVSYTDGHGDDTDNASAINALPVTPEPNRPPQFGEHTATFNISINVREGVRVAPPFTATDPNGDTLTYSIVSDTANAFTINAETGEVLMGSLEMSEGATYTASISVNDGVNEQWQEDRTADDSLDLTMTMINPNIMIEPSSRQAFPRGLWVYDDIVVTANEVSGYSNRDQAMVYDRATQQHLEDRGFPVGGRSYPDIQGVWSDGNTIYVLANLKSRSTPKGKVFAYRLSDGARQKSKDISLHRNNSHPYGITGHDGVMYVGDNSDDKVYAYNIESGGPPEQP